VELASLARAQSLRSRFRGGTHPPAEAEIFRHSPSGKVPVLKTDVGVIYDSLSIIEYLAEQHPEAKLWPESREARAAGSSISAEMHAGFQALRNDMPMDLISNCRCPR
jgi:glutathione S-transferase